MEDNLAVKIDNSKKTLVLKTLKQKNGNVSEACKAANIARPTFYVYMKTDEDFANAVDDIRESLLDMAESQLMKQINDGNTTSLIFYLKTQGRSRGYGDEVALTGKNGKDLIPDTARFMPETITINVVGDDKSKD